MKKSTLTVVGGQWEERTETDILAGWICYGMMKMF